MCRRQFTLADQLRFAELSGDNNPVHVDPLTARRSMFGQPIVHGVHTLMWLLDEWVKSRTEPVQLRKLQVNFLKAVGLNDVVNFTVPSGNETAVRLELFRDGEVVVRASFEWTAGKAPDGVVISPNLPAQQPPVCVSRAAIKACEGFLNLHLDSKAASALFPNLTRWFCPQQTAVLLGLTRLVGVECPGLHSIFSELKWVATEGSDAAGIKYHVAKFDDRIGLVALQVVAPGLSVNITAFVRPPPQAQPTYESLVKLVSTEIFAGQRALVVGGSRGLGEVAAKLLAAGGATVQLTYQRGRQDAQKVADEITAGGGVATLTELDILQPTTHWLGATAPTHLYFFASPFIASSGQKNFSAKLFREFCDYYVTGFGQLAEQLQKAGLQKTFYPSTIFIDEPPTGFVEYVAAKSAGEAVCRGFAKKYPGTFFFCPRLPKMATDQTASFMPSKNADPVPVILSALLKFNEPPPLS